MIYAPGCALLIYKPQLAKQVLKFLANELDNFQGEHQICCRHEPKLPTGTKVINTCAGCDKRYRELYKGISTISLWEILDKAKNFKFPNYNGLEMTVLDACPTRTETRVHNAIRNLLQKMNIKVIEPEKTKTNSVCCGDSFYKILPVEEVKKQMKKRADEMPCNDVVVYCVSCINAMHLGGKKPRYIVDLLFDETTKPKIIEPEQWHNELDKFIENH